MAEYFPAEKPEMLSITFEKDLDFLFHCFSTKDPLQVRNFVSFKLLYTFLHVLVEFVHNCANKLVHMPNNTLTHA